MKKRQKHHKENKTGKNTEDGKKTICANTECRLRKAGCRGFEGCPGYLKK